jgi:DNA-binding transcriptional ArsR family regulator
MTVGSVGDFARNVPLSRPAVPQHLCVLREAGLVVATRAGARHLFAATAIRA